MLTAVYDTGRSANIMETQKDAEKHWEPVEPHEHI